MNKSEQLIACLEGEIAKRDARIVELEDLCCEWVKKASSTWIERDQLRAELSAIKAQEPVAFAFRYDDGSWHDVSSTQHSAGMVSLYAAPVSEAKAQGVVMPERLKPSRYELQDARVDAWNSCLDEVARLNAALYAGKEGE